MLVKTDIPNLLLAGIKKEFMKSLKMHEAEWNRVATLIKSSKSSETYAWLKTPLGHEKFNYMLETL